MKKIKLLIIFCCLSVNIFPQAPDTLWTKMYTPAGMYGTPTQAVGTCGHETPDGGFIIAGWCSNPWVKGYLLRLDAGGNIIWTKEFFDDVSGSFICRSLEATGDGGFILAGDGTNSSGGAVWLIKTDADGSIVWSNSFGEPENSYVISSMKITDDNGFIISGTVTNSSYRPDMFLLKVNNNGIQEWLRIFDFGEFEISLSLEKAQDSGYLMSGIGGLADTVLICKVDDSGNMLWRKNYPTVEQADDFQSLIKTREGGYALAGGNGNFYLLILDAEGNLQNQFEFGNYYVDPDGVTQFYEEDATSIYQTGDGGFIMTGSSNIIYDTEYEIWTIKISAQGDQQWSRIIQNGTGSSHGSFVEQTRDGGYLIIGDCRLNPDGMTCLYIIRLKGNTTGIKRTEKIQSFELYQNYPNPFNPATTISWYSPEDAMTELKIFDCLGNEMGTLLDEYKTKGIHKIEFNSSSNEFMLSSGIYYYRLTVGNKIQTKKLLLLK